MENFDIFDLESAFNGLNESTTDNNNENFGIFDIDANVDAMLSECILCESLSSDELYALMEDSNLVDELKESNILTEATKVVKITMNRDSQMQRLTTMMVYQIAREKKDKLFNKLIKAWKVKKFLSKQLYAKYGSAAKTRAAKRYTQLRKSKNSTVRKAAR